MEGTTTPSTPPALVDRIKAIITDPKAEWPVIEREVTTVEKLYREYIVLLAAIPVVGSMIGSMAFGVSVPFVGTFRTPIVEAVVTAVFSYVMALLGVYIAAFIIDKLAPTFDSKPDLTQALKLVAYAYTPVWVVGVLNIIPPLGFLASFLAALYCIYVFYLGVPVMMKTPEAKVIPYMIVSAVIIIVVSIVLAVVAGIFTGLFFVRPY